MSRRKMDKTAFKKAMKRRGIDSEEVVRRANLKRKVLTLG